MTVLQLWGNMVDSDDFIFQIAKFLLDLFYCQKNKIDRILGDKKREKE